MKQVEEGKNEIHLGEEMNLHLGHLHRMSAPRVWGLWSVGMLVCTCDGTIRWGVGSRELQKLEI